MAKAEKPEAQKDDGSMEVKDAASIKVGRPTEISLTMHGVTTLKTVRTDNSGNIIG